MGIKFRCEHCHKSVEAPDKSGGRRGKCPYCSQSTYIPSPVSEDEILPVAPVDEEEEKQREKEISDLISKERDLLAETGGDDDGPPLEHRDDVTPEDLHHFVINYLLCMADSKLEQAESQAARLKKFRHMGAQAVEDFKTGKADDEALRNVPDKLKEAFLKQLSDSLQS